MALQTDLMNLGIGGPLVAATLGYNPITLTATGTSSGTAAIIRSKMTQISSASSQTGAILPAVVGDIFLLNCKTGSGASAVVYPPSGATLNNASSVTLAADKSMIAWSFSATLWFYVILA